ncbi:heme peroxidase [Nocardioides sp. MAH-18]|uniref:Heme peroxidase n=1 Tax=Nocardioides agri TaxID=2682843 RepID=A0A6L6XX28_9ACTN|nr:MULTISPECIES: heme peroxidase family protein [unclassified Nocardioides]MBA2952456.1 heme peroxidase [Nocardioides sp. CGMCC 1.13656]MVQ51618.1 heme peroxidase [Nocardioides sp. MAH-18]
MTARHGSESFFIEGEGLVNTQVGGRSGDEPDPVTDPGAAGPVAKRADAAPPFRFSRVGPRGRTVPEPLTLAIADAMTKGGGGVGDIPAGYTYLGQFIDHDLTMDATSVALGTDISPAELLQGRSPTLDLDSLYGAGPADAESAKFYEPDGVHLRTGDTIRFGPDRAKVAHDLPRVGTGNRRARRKALIPDPRNDENLIVAQTHLAMIRFHNRVADKLPAALPPAQRFRRARRSVTLHYHWLLRHDYLARVVDPALVDDVFANGRKVVQPNADPTSLPTMPVEFSVAAFRLGHSMIRPVYDWNRRFPKGIGFLDYMFQFSALGGDLGGEDRLISNWLADWRRMYDFPTGGHPGLAGPDGFNRAQRIDSLLTDPLKNLPPSTFGGGAGIPFDDRRRNLAFRNLTRASMLRLASGQQMVAKLRAEGVTVRPLTRAQILRGSGGADLSGLTAAQKDAVVARTPLWLYVLREAETGDGRLRGVGGRIVAETFHRAMEGSRFSLLRNPGFTPVHGRGTTFEMTDLLFFALGGKTGVNPLGGA